MIEIHMKNVTSKIDNLDDNLKTIIFEKLSYEVGGFGIKKSTKYLYNPNTSMTYTGLIPHIINTLNLLNVKYKVNDLRDKPLPNANFKINTNFESRDYQKEIIDRATSREIIQAATGAGKTFIMAKLIEKFNVKPVLIIAPKISLAKQIKKEFEKFFEISIGMLGGGYNQIKDITISTPQSVDENLVKSAKFILFDESHHLPSATIYSISNKALNAYYRVGVSATPWRDSGDDILIEAALNIRKPKLSINASKLIQIGKLVPCEINFIYMDSKTNWLKNYKDTYETAIVNNKERNDKIVELALNSLKQNRTILILVNQINHGNKILNELKQKYKYEEKLSNKNGKTFNIGNVEFISGENNYIKQDLILKSVEEGFTKILISTTIADEGLDITCLDTLILAGSGKSSTKAFQRVGRVLRLNKNKEKAIVYDFIDSNDTFFKHSMLREALYKTEPLWKINYI